jgi:NADH-quinone oxidoreductase subunit J
VVIGLAALAELIALGQVSHWATGRPASPSPPGPNVNQLAERIFTRYLYAFEVTSVLLVIAVVGAVVLARRARREHEAIREPEEVAP